MRMTVKSEGDFAVLAFFMWLQAAKFFHNETIFFIIGCKVTTILCKDHALSRLFLLKQILRGKSFWVLSG